MVQYHVTPMKWDAAGLVIISGDSVKAPDYLEWTDRGIPSRRFAVLEGYDEYRWMFGIDMGEVSVLVKIISGSNK